ncbi:hypothetical protein JCM11641_004804 [Rhodosporidiobolus odoratus]
MSEDAAVLLADFVSSLDNLPSEVCHILEEIGHKEGRVSDLRSRATQRDQALQKHARPPAQGGQGLLVPNPKEETSTKKIRLDLDNAEVTTREKVALAERGVNLLSRHLNRLQAQLELLTSTVPPLPTLPSFAPNAPAPTPNALFTSQPTYTDTPGGTGSYNPYAQTYGQPTPGTPAYQDKRRTSAAANTPMQVPLLPAQLASAQSGLPSGYQFAQTPGVAPPGTPLAAAGSRRAGPSRLQNVAYASPAPMGTPGAPQPQPNHLAFLQQQQQMQQMQQRFAHAQAQALQQQAQQQQQQILQAQQAQAQAVAQAQGRKRKQEDDSRAGSVREEESVEAEGEDLTPYCFCQRPSFGEMIGCDARDCKIEWFHLNCIGLKESPEGSWYCSQCETRMKQQGRGRRKA